MLFTYVVAIAFGHTLFCDGWGCEESEWSVDFIS